MSVTYDPGNRVILHRCDHQGPTLVYQGVCQSREIDVNHVVSAAGVHCKTTE